MTDQLKQLIEEGYPVTREDIARLSPYVTSNIKRFGDYVLNLDAEVPELERAWTWAGPPSQEPPQEIMVSGSERFEGFVPAAG